MDAYIEAKLSSREKNMNKVNNVLSSFLVNIFKCFPVKYDFGMLNVWGLTLDIHPSEHCRAIFFCVEKVLYSLKKLTL